MFYYFVDTTSSSVPNNTHSNNNYLYSTYGSNQDQSYGNSATTTAGFKDPVQQPVSYPKVSEHKFVLST